MSVSHQTKPYFKVDSIQSQRRFSDKTNIYADIDKPKPSTHCFSGTSDYTTFEYSKNLLTSVFEAKNCKRIHVICDSCHTELPFDIQLQFHNQNVHEIVLFTTDMRYLCQNKVLIHV